MVQEVTNSSWGSRIVNAFFGILVGIVLIIASFVLIFWNEGHGLHMAQSLQQAEKVLISVPDSPINTANNLHVVHLTGTATTKDILHDKLFGISENAIQLHRHVEMYQWKQTSESHTESKLGGSEQTTKTYSYAPVWSDTLIDSTAFKDPTGHQNPAEMPVNSKKVYAKSVTVGDFKLPHDLVKQIEDNTTVDLAKIDLTQIKSDLDKKVVIHNDYIYAGADPLYPKVGDLRIHVTVVRPQTVSIIAQQNGHTLEPYMAPAGQKVSLLVMGDVSSQQMIADAQSSNTMMMWILRLVSLFMMIIGIALLMGPITVLADVIPFLGSLASAGTFLIAFVVGLLLWTIAIAIAWFVVRPLWSVGLIMLVSVLCYVLIKRKKNQSVKT